MDITNSVKAFAALAQENRLKVFRLLVRYGHEGMSAGEIARRFDVPQNTMSSHLSILANAGLVTAERQGRSIIYRTDFVGTRELLSFIMEDCCQGASDVCDPAIASLLPKFNESQEGETRHETPSR